MAHTMNGLIIAIDTLRCLSTSCRIMGCSYRPTDTLEAMIWSSAYLPVNATLLALSLCILGRHVGRYFRLCGWLVALAFAAAVNAVVLAVGIALLLLW